MPEISELTVGFCGDVRLIEARFLAIGWMNPRRLRDAACDAGLAAVHFAYGTHSLVFYYLCRAVEEDVLDRISVGDCASEAAKLSLVLDPFEWLDDALEARAACPGDVTDELAELAQAIVAFGGRRARATTLLDQVGRLLNGDATTIEELYQQGAHRAGFTPKRIQRMHGGTNNGR